jgi:hypothetical protein
VDAEHAPQTANDGVTGQVQLPLRQLAVTGVISSLSIPLYKEALSGNGSGKPNSISTESARLYHGVFIGGNEPISAGLPAKYCQFSARGILPGRRLLLGSVIANSVIARSCWTNVLNANEMIVMKAPI